MSTTPRRKSKGGTQAEENLMSPTRVTRLQEKKQLHDLNKRLEHYILEQRRRDASQDVLARELDAVRNLGKEEMDHAENLWKDQIVAARNERDNEAAERNKFEAECRRLTTMLGNAQEELEETKERADEWQSQVENLTRNKNDLEVELMQANEAARASNVIADKYKKRNTVLDDELDTARAVAEDSTERAALAESKVRSLEEDYDILKLKTTAEIQRLRDMVDDLTRKNAHVEEETRKEFAKQLQEIVKERQQEWDDSQDEALAELRAVYEEKLEAYRDHLERSGHELENMRARVKESEQESAEKQAEAEEFIQEKVHYIEKIEELQNQVKEVKHAPSKKIAELKEIIRRIKASFKRKDKEFDNLMDVKIALALEIKQYRDLLEREEERLGYNTPAKEGTKKRKRNNTEEGDEDDEEEVEGEGEDAEEKDAEETLVFSSMDLHGEYIAIRNTSTEEISLDGYNLQSEANRIKFDFPEGISLVPGATVTVWTGPEAAENEDFPTAVAWVDDEVWNPAGDTALLVDAENHVIAEVKIVPTRPDVSTEEIEGAMNDDKKDPNCAIM